MAPGKPASEVCATANAHAHLQARCDSFHLAMLGSVMSLSLAITNLIGFGVTSAAVRLAWSGSLPLGPACKLGYQATVLGSLLNIVQTSLLFSICMQLTWFRLIGLSYLEVDLFIIALALVGSIHAIWKIYDAQPYVPNTSAVVLIGTAEPPEPQPGISSLLERIAESLHCPPPDTVIYGLEPSIQCTRRPVDLDGKEIRGLTLFLSLPSAGCSRKPNSLP